MGNDTVVQITLPQMDSANACFDYLYECREVADTLRAQVKDCAVVVALQADKIVVLQKDSAAQATIGAERVGQLAGKDKEIKRAKTSAKVTGVLLYIATTAAAIFAIIAAIK